MEIDHGQYSNDLQREERRAVVKQQRVEEARVRMLENEEFMEMINKCQMPHDVAARLYEEIRLPFPARKIILSTGEMTINMSNVYLDEEWEELRQGVTLLYEDLESRGILRNKP